MGNTPATAPTSAMRRITSFLRRVASFVVTLLVTFVGLTAVTFFISRLTNIDPVLAVVGDKATQAAYDSAYKALGLDQPLFFQYLIYLKRLVTGDFGMSVLTSQPVLTDLLRVFPATFELATIAIIIGVAARRSGRCARRCHQGPLARSGDPRGRPLRLLGPGLLAWPRRPLRLLRQARLGRRHRAPRCLLPGRRHPAHRHHPHRRRARRQLGDLCSMPSAT